MNTWWQRSGRYEYEVGENGYTGWIRCVDGQLADGRWPQWREKKVRY